MRTIKRSTLPLNKEKLQAISSVCVAASKEKQQWLFRLRSWKFQALLDKPRKIRDLFVEQNYQSKFGLQARHWKLSLEDACATWSRYWEGLFEKVRPKIASYAKQDEERHYGFWLLKGSQQFSALMQGKIPKPPFHIEKNSCERIFRFVRRAVKKLIKKTPSVKKAHSATFDANCYSVFEHNGTQYLSLMSLERGKRIVLPLKGHKKIQGNLTVIVKGSSVTIHQTEDLSKKKIARKEVVEAVDFGYTEVMTDTEGSRYGTHFGELLTKASDKNNDKMKKRNRLHALSKENRRKHAFKAQRIRTFNLGRHKLVATRNRVRASLECEVNRAINSLIKTQHFSVLVTEDLRHTFSYDGPKSLNRRFSSWIRGKIQDRVAFKALAEGFRHEQVNPAYGSQTCPKCYFVDEKNRSQDKFLCLYCRYEDRADRVAAVNYKRRYSDQKIGRYTPYRQVKTILLQEFHRRLETEQSVTVPGRTLETVQGMYPPCPVETIVIADCNKVSFANQAVNQRAKHKMSIF